MNAKGFEEIALHGNDWRVCLGVGRCGRYGLKVDMRRQVRFARFRKYADFTPLGTAALVMLVGVGLAMRALAG